MNRSGRSVFIREDASIGIPVPCDYSISTFAGSGEKYLFDYFDFTAFKDTYDHIFFELIRRIKENKFPEKSSYLGVELLSCFSLYLFNYVSSSAILVSALNNFLEKNPYDTVYASRDRRDRDNPDIRRVILACLPKIQPRVRSIKLVPKNLQEKQSKNSTVISELKSRLWPKKISFLRNKPAIAFFSDYQRIKCLIPLLRPSAIYFTNRKSPKIFFRSLKERISYGQISGIMGDQKRYIEDADRISRQIQDSDIFKDMKTDQCDLEIILKQRIGQLCQDQLPELLYQIDEMSRFFIKNPGVKKVLLDEDMTPPKNAFCQIARKRSIMSFVECHGALYGAYSYVPLTADHIFAWGSEQKNTLVSWGCPAEKIITSGCSRYEQYSRLDDAKVRKRIFRQFKFNEDIKTVLFIPQSRASELCFIEKTIFEKIESILDVILKYPNLQVIIKLHPSDVDFGYYRDRCNQPDVKCKVRILKKFDPYLLTKASDFMIVHDSTMAIDGFALKRNVIFFLATEALSKVLRNSISDFEKYNIFYHPSNMEDFKNIFERLLKESPLRPEGARWEDARRECLNEGTSLPENIIASYLLNGRTRER